MYYPAACHALFPRGSLPHRIALRRRLALLCDLGLVSVLLLSPMLSVPAVPVLFRLLRYAALLPIPLSIQLLTLMFLVRLNWLITTLHSTRSPLTRIVTSLPSFMNALTRFSLLLLNETLYSYNTIHSDTLALISYSLRSGLLAIIGHSCGRIASGSSLPVLPADAGTSRNGALILSNLSLRNTLLTISLLICSA